jgi:hypothetical protein
MFWFALCGDNLGHLIFFLKGYLGLMTWVMCPSTLDFIFIGLSLSHDLGSKFDGLDSVFFISFSSNFNI